MLEIEMVCLHQVLGGQRQDLPMVLDYLVMMIYHHLLMWTLMLMMMRIRKREDKEELYRRSFNNYYPLPLSYVPRLDRGT